jgi:hypothetical protein
MRQECCDGECLKTIYTLTNINLVLLRAIHPLLTGTLVLLDSAQSLVEVYARLLAANRKEKHLLKEG